MQGNWIAVVLLGAGLVFAAAEKTLEEIKAEKNLERRAGQYLDYADKRMDSLGAIYRAGEWKKVEATLGEVVEAVVLAQESLKETGKDPRRHSKHFKRAEKATRELIRRLEGFSEDVSYDERATVEKARKRVEKVHDELLLGILGKKS